MKHLEDNLTTIAPVTRREKLFLWASIVRAHPYPLVLFHNLEYVPQSAYRSVMFHHLGPSAFSTAANSGSFPGLPTMPNLEDIVRYFDLSPAELHEFSCDCGGAITNSDMAMRLERIAR